MLSTSVTHGNSSRNPCVFRPLPITSVITHRGHTMPHRAMNVNTPGQSVDLFLIAGVRAARAAAAPGSKVRRSGSLRVGCMSRNRSENPVVLSRIYTRTGDDGTTALADGSRTAKTDARLAAYADVEEANCAIGVAITFGNLSADISGLLTRVQNELFDVGADLANPATDAPPPYPPLRIAEAYVTRLENECDSYNEELPTLRSFLLPGGSPGATLLHIARTG